MQERPCSRCIKRSIGHLCHDEPKENVKGKSEQDAASAHDNSASQGLIGPSIDDLNSGKERSMMKNTATDMSYQGGLPQAMPTSTQPSSGIPSDIRGLDDTNQQCL